MELYLVYGLTLLILILFSKYIGIISSLTRYLYLGGAVYYGASAASDWKFWSLLSLIFIMSFFLFSSSDKKKYSTNYELYNRQNRSMSAVGIGLLIGLVISLGKYLFF